VPKVQLVIQVLKVNKVLRDQQDLLDLQEQEVHKEQLEDKDFKE
jgi:hypothetical protein